MARKNEFQPDRPVSGLLSKLYLTRRQRQVILKWSLYGLLLVALSVLQDVLLWLKNQSLSGSQRSYSYEQTFIDLITEGQTDERNLKTVLGILNWKQKDRYLCLKLQSQNTEDIVHSDLAVNSRLSTVLGGHVSFRYQQKICTIVNLSMSGIDLGELRQRLAPLVRDKICNMSIRAS